MPAEPPFMAVLEILAQHHRTDDEDAAAIRDCLAAYREQAKRIEELERDVNRLAPQLLRVRELCDQSTRDVTMPFSRALDMIDDVVREHDNANT